MKCEILNCNSFIHIFYFPHSQIDMNHAHFFLTFVLNVAIKIKIVRFLEKSTVLRTQTISLLHLRFYNHYRVAVGVV